jgi:hypothetical protein
LVGAVAARQGDVNTAVAGALLALVLSAAMWCLYFGREERDSKALLDRVPAGRRPRVAVFSFGHAY